LNKAKKLLRKGYFPSQLPPPFTTSTFATVSSTLAAAWPTQYHKIPSTRGEHFSVARAGHMRRPVTIPHPINQYYLAATLDTHWADIQAHFKKSKLSLSRPTLNRGGERATEIAPLSELYERRLTLSAGYKYVLKTDISRFFPTLYTHSIPWALHSKAVAKANSRNFTPAFFGNVIDMLVQRCQHRQTLGIPIGPDTSHVIAETIACSADLAIRDRLGKWPVGYRHVDDYFMCFNTSVEAENALSAILSALREFELDINVSKTQISKVEDLLEDSWVDPIRSFDFEVANGNKQRNDIHRFFMMAFDLGRNHSDENVMKYALRKSSSFRVNEENWSVYESYILKAARAQLNTLQTAVGIIATYHSLGYQLDKSRIKRFCESVVQDAAPLGHHSEVAWALWLAIELDLKLSKALCTPLEAMNSGACALMALDCRERGVLPALQPRALWMDSMNGNGLRGTMWLLVYEASKKGWLPDKAPGFMAADDFFGHLSAANVTFYDERRKLKPLIKRVKRDFGGLGIELEDDFEFEDQYDGYVS
jgi:hypothetical protein